MLHLKGREQGLYHFMTLAPSFAMTPGELTRTTGVYWLNPVDMKPLINSFGHAKVLEYLKDLAQCGAAELEPGQGVALLPAARCIGGRGHRHDHLHLGRAPVQLLARHHQTKMMPAHMVGAVDTRSVQACFMATCALITMVPPVLLALIAQRYIMRGLTLGGERVTARGDAARRCGHWSVYGMP